jgi:hypothetical protein
VEGVSEIAASIWVGPSRQEQLHHFVRCCIGGRRREVQRARPKAVEGIQIAACIEEKDGTVLSVTSAGNMKGCVTFGIPDFGICSPIQKRAHGLLVVAPHCPVKRGVSRAVLEIQCAGMVRQGLLQTQLVSSENGIMNEC